LPAKAKLPYKNNNKIREKITGRIMTVKRFIICLIGKLYFILIWRAINYPTMLPPRSGKL